MPSPQDYRELDRNIAQLKAIRNGREEPREKALLLAVFIGNIREDLFRALSSDENINKTNERIGSFVKELRFIEGMFNQPVAMAVKQLITDLASIATKNTPYQRQKGGKNMKESTTTLVRLLNEFTLPK